MKQQEFNVEEVEQWHYVFLVHKSYSFWNNETKRMFMPSWKFVKRRDISVTMFEGVIHINCIGRFVFDPNKKMNLKLRGKIQISQRKYFRSWSCIMNEKAKESVNINRFILNVIRVWEVEVNSSKSQENIWLANVYYH